MKFSILVLSLILIHNFALADAVPLRYIVNEPQHKINTGIDGGVPALVEYIVHEDKCVVDIFERFMDLENRQELQTLRDRILDVGREMRVEVTQSAAPKGPLSSFDYSVRLISWKKGETKELGTNIFSFSITASERCRGMKDMLGQKNALKIDDVTVQGLTEMHASKFSIEYLKKEALKKIQQELPADPAMI